MLNTIAEKKEVLASREYLMQENFQRERLTWSSCSKNMPREHGGRPRRKERATKRSKVLETASKFKQDKENGILGAANNKIIGRIKEKEKAVFAVTKIPLVEIEKNILSNKNRECSNITLNRLSQKLKVGLYGHGKASQKILRRKPSVELKASNIDGNLQRVLGLKENLQVPKQDSLEEMTKYETQTEVQGTESNACKVKEKFPAVATATSNAAELMEPSLVEESKEMKKTKFEVAALPSESADKVEVQGQWIDKVAKNISKGFNLDVFGKGRSSLADSIKIDLKKMLRQNNPELYEDLMQRLKDRNQPAEMECSLSKTSSSCFSSEQQLVSNYPVVAEDSQDMDFPMELTEPTSSASTEVQDQAPLQSTQEPDLTVKEKDDFKFDGIFEVPASEGDVVITSSGGSQANEHIVQSGGGSHLNTSTSQMAQPAGQFPAHSIPYLQQQGGVFMPHPPIHQHRNTVALHQLQQQIIQQQNQNGTALSGHVHKLGPAGQFVVLANPPNTKWAIMRAPNPPLASCQTNLIEPQSLVFDGSHYSTIPPQIDQVRVLADHPRTWDLVDIIDQQHLPVNQGQVIIQCPNLPQVGSVAPQSTF